MCGQPVRARRGERVRADEHELYVGQLPGQPIHEIDVDPVVVERADVDGDGAGRQVRRAGLRGPHVLDVDRVRDEVNRPGRFAPSLQLRAADDHLVGLGQQELLVPATSLQLPRRHVGIEPVVGDVVDRPQIAVVRELGVGAVVDPEHRAVEPGPFHGPPDLVRERPVDERPDRAGQPLARSEPEHARLVGERAQVGAGESRQPV